MRGLRLVVSNSDSRTEHRGYLDYTLVFIVLFFLAFGLIMLYSTSSYEAALKYNDPAHWLRKQVFATCIGLAAMMVAAAFPYQYWRYLVYAVYGVAVFSILLIIPFGVEANGAKRWLNFYGISVQPAEIAKIAVIIYTAYKLEKLGRKVLTPKGFISALFPAALLSAMVYVITKNMSSAVIIAAIAFGMVFVACPDYKRFIVIIGAVAAAGAGVVFWIVRNAASAESGGFRGKRILAWLDPQAFSDTTSYQTLQGLYAIGSGGYFGKGLGQSMQKLGYIPEAQNDMIFSIICEELGLFGAIGILLMFVMLIWRLFIIANNTDDFFGGLLVSGVLIHIATQVFMNVAVVTNTMPNTGVTLPFISYGGTSVCFLLSEIGLCLSVAHGIKLRNIE